MVSSAYPVVSAAASAVYLPGVPEHGISDEAAKRFGDFYDKFPSTVKLPIDQHARQELIKPNINKIQGAEELIKILGSFDDPTHLGFLILAAVEIPDVDILSHIKATKPEQFEDSLKIAIKLASTPYKEEVHLDRPIIYKIFGDKIEVNKTCIQKLFREKFFNYLLSGCLGPFCNSETLKDALSAPVYSFNSLCVKRYILGKLSLGKLDRKVFLEIFQSAVDYSDFNKKTGLYLKELLNSPHNPMALDDFDYVDIFNSSYNRHSQHNRGGLRLLLEECLSISRLKDIVDSLVYKEEPVVEKIFSLIFEVYQNPIWLDALKKEIEKSDHLVRKIQSVCPNLWNMIISRSSTEAETSKGSQASDNPECDSDGACRLPFDHDWRPSDIAGANFSDSEDE